MNVPGCITELDEKNKAFINGIDELLKEHSYVSKITEKDGKIRITYSSPKTKRALLSFTTSGDNVKVHIYADNISRYINDILPLPDAVADSIRKGRECDGLADPGSCDPKCVKGYDLVLDNVRYQRCRYMNLKFEVNDDTRECIGRIAMKEMHYKK
jgi:hypothetical protein